MILTKYIYKLVKGVFLHEIIQKANALKGWELFSMTQEREGHYTGILKKRVIR
jgi:hypothetical protein